ncbi:IQ motif and ubiquitin-like domain-containing protein [Branchiostoma floridae x Branchiostoma japonicum]
MADQEESAPAAVGETEEPQAEPQDQAEGKAEAEQTDTEEPAKPAEAPAAEDGAETKAEAADDTAQEQPAETAAADTAAAETAEVEQTAAETAAEQTGESTAEPADTTAEETAAEEPPAPEEEVKQPPKVEPTPTPEPGQVPNVPTPSRENISMATVPTAEIHHVDPHAVSPVPLATSADATATVKFVLMPSGHVTTLACALSQTMLQLKDHFSVELRMPAELILITLNGKKIPDSTTLGELGVGPNATIQLEISSADPVNTPIKSIRPKPEYVMPDILTVRVPQDDGKLQDVVVEIERPTRRKPYLGGYRHKLSGVEYHHASAQTMGRTTSVSDVQKFCRDTQTVFQKNRVQQTTNHTSTQMTKVGCYVSNMQDKLMLPGRYQSAEEYHKIRLEAVIVLQAYFRRWQAKNIVQRLREDKARRLEWERLEEIRKKREKEQRIRKEFERRMNPKTKEDFDLLYAALEKWRQEELAFIDENYSGAERKARLCALLDQETQLISAIDRHKIDASKENKEKSIQHFLDQAAGPKKWRAFDGKITEMDTPYTQRARELRDIYNSINMKYLTQDERLDVLLTLKHTVKEHNCKLTQEIIELIDREADLLMRGVKDSNMEGLRKRISTLFLQYIKTPTFNAEAARLLKVPQDPMSLRKNIYFCPSCGSYKPSMDFPMSSNTRLVGKCRKCQKLDNDARQRQDFSIYRTMLRQLRRSEEAYGDGSRIAFLLQEADLQYLVENVWNSQSILSAWDDLYDLVLVRWDKTEEWSPWNCILLTKEEASAHKVLDDLEEQYGPVFIHKAQHKHTLARNYFARLPGMAQYMREKLAASKQKGPSVMGHRMAQTTA